MIPKPLPPHSRLLEKSRVQVNISEPHATRPGSRMVIRTARFQTMSHARTWAEAVRQPGQYAQLTTYSAYDGWTAHAAGTLKDTGWTQF